MRPLLEEDGIRFHPDGLTGFEPLSHCCGGEPIRASDAFGSVYGGRKKKQDKELGSPPQLLADTSARSAGSFKGFRVSRK